MVKLKKFIRIPYEENSSFSEKELKERLDGIIKDQGELALYKLKGSPLFLLEKEKEENQYCLKYHHSYKTDMCDTCLRFYIEKGLEKCSVKGYACKTAGSWAVFWGVIATLLIDFLIITYCLLFTANFDLMKALMISFCAVIVRAYICLSALRFNSRRLEEIEIKMMEILGVEPEKNGERNEENERD